MLFEISRITFLLFFEMSPYLLLGLAFVGIMNMWISKDMVARHIGGHNFWSLLKAALFGIPLPLCSCGVVPTAIFMSQNKASKPSVISFLTSTPQTGIDSIIATYGMMGPVFAVFRPIAALIMGVSAGVVTLLTHEKPKPKKDFSFGLNVLSGDEKEKEEKTATEKLLKYPFIEFLDDIAPQFILGLFIAGIISYFFPDDFLAELGMNSGILAMVIIVLVSAPMYICATASIPIAVTLLAKGFSPGAAFVFLAAGPATNVASYAILSKAIGQKTTLIFVASVVVLSIAFGLVLDEIFLFAGLNPLEYIVLGDAHQHAVMSSPLSVISGIILGILLIGSVYRIYFKKYFSKNNVKLKKGESIIKISGMTCSHCENTVKNAIESTGAKVVKVDHISGSSIISGDVNLDLVKKKIEDSGYSVK